MIDVMRAEPWMPLTADQTKAVREVKDAGNALWAMLDAAKGDKRQLAVAKTTLETTIMWAVKGLTTADTA